MSKQTQVEELMRKGFRAMGMINYKEALAFYQEAINQDPNYQPAYREKGYVLFLNSKDPEAIDCLQKGEALNTNSSIGQTCKAMYLHIQGKKDESNLTFQKAIQTDPSDAMAHLYQGYFLLARGKNEEALKTLNQAVTINPKNVVAHSLRGRAFAGLNEYEEMIECFEQTMKLDPEYIFGYLHKGANLNDFRLFEEAIECFDIVIKANPNSALAYNEKGNALAIIDREEEAMTCYKKCYELEPHASANCSNYANSLVDLGKFQEAIPFYDQALAIEPNNSLVLCSRGNALNKIGKTEDALKDFTKAYYFLKAGDPGDFLSPENINYIKETIGGLIELQKTANETSSEAEQVLKGVDKENPVAKRFIAKLKNLNENKQQTANKIIDEFGKSGDKTSEFKKEMDELKKEYLALKQEMTKEINQLKATVAQIQGDIKDIRDELDNKMDDYAKKLDKELIKADKSTEEITKIKEYFSAYVNTFSSLYVTAQVVDSGQVKLDTDSTKATLLSAAASFAPFVGNFLSSAITSLNDFLQSKEMKQNARKMKGLSSDSVELSQLVGGAAFKITTNQNKQTQITQITKEDMREKTNSLYKKILEFCKNIGEETDALLYGKLYKTSAAQLGHNDANSIIEQWLKLEIHPSNTQEAFVEMGIKVEIPKQDAPKVENEIIVKHKSSACCNMF